jgi:hypothetical protein
MDQVSGSYAAGLVRWQAVLSAIAITGGPYYVFYGG